MSDCKAQRKKKRKSELLAGSEIFTNELVTVRLIEESKMKVGVSYIVKLWYSRLLIKIFAFDGLDEGNIAKTFDVLQTKLNNNSGNGGSQCC